MRMHMLMLMIMDVHMALSVCVRHCSVCSVSVCMIMCVIRIGAVRMRVLCCRTTFVAKYIDL